MNALGDFIGGQFVAPEGQTLVSVNPAQQGKTVFETAWSKEHMLAACSAADVAWLSWNRLPLAERFSYLARFKESLAKRHKELAQAISLEVGKVNSDAAAEVQTVLGRFDITRRHVEAELVDKPIPGRPGESLRHHALGVVGVIGPFNFPLHLCHAHVVPALLTGNTVVMKPSEVAPMAAQLYAEALQEAKFPPGVINVVQGTGISAAELVRNPAVRGICFTGSYRVGKLIATQAIERPELLPALEMGGKNFSVVLDDADLHQAAHEVVVGGYLTTGQRCTCTERVLVHRSKAKAFLDILRPMIKGLPIGDPNDKRSFAGPMATASGRERYGKFIAVAQSAGVEIIAQSAGPSDAFFAQATVHLIPSGHHVAGYTDEELFGPDVAVSMFDSDDEAISVLRENPYGLATSVFTGNDERFENFFRQVRCGVMNRNRSTNQASSELPFGGIGKSGNYRPAGSFASKNTVYPVGVQQNVLGWQPFLPALVELMPPPDLDRLEGQHMEEECRESARSLLTTPRPLKRLLPKGGKLPTSEKWLRRLYAGDRVVDEKKPPVFDHLRSFGPWFVSVDDEPLSVLDGMSQTATSCGGFAEPNVVRAYVEGEFGTTLLQNRDISVELTPPAQRFADVLRQMVPGLPCVTYVNSGAEANEKAMALCRMHASNPKATKLMVFDGSFHGRTWLALHATANPAKRKRFELPGYLATFAPFPTWTKPSREEPRAPSGYLACAATGDIEQLKERYGDPEDDAVLAAEVASLQFLHEHFSSGDYYACFVEPMQSEGGDRYATARFFRALRLLTRYHKIPLAFDEVQTGFALGGSFAWHSDFLLVNARGLPDYPDVVTFAKRAQVGVVMSAWPDPEPSASHEASLVRGLLHAEMVSTEHSAERIEELVRTRLHALANAFPELVGNPRCKGYAFAFDLPNADMLNAFLGQRFWRGAIVFGAGSQTARYRLSEGYLLKDVDALFDCIRRQLAWVLAHPGKQPPAWEDSNFANPMPATPPKTAAPRIRQILGPEAETFLAAMLEMERGVYEPARRTPTEEIRAAIHDPESIVTIAEVQVGETQWQFVGFAIALPLEKAGETEEGPDRDCMRGEHNSAYSLALTVDKNYHDSGIGRLIKVAQLEEAARRKTKDGKPRYSYVTGRNRVGMTARMMHLNWAYGAHTVEVLTGQYEDPEGQAIYYRIPLVLGPGRAPKTESSDAKMRFDLTQGLSIPLAQPPASLIMSQQSGLLYGPTVNKITLMNYATTASIRALEWVSAVLPRLPHLYLTSSRDECVDKSLRIMKYHRAEATVALSFQGAYVGHTTATARSISDPVTHRGGVQHFAWPLLPHPSVVGTDAAVGAIKKAITDAGGPKFILGLVFEPLQERTGRTMPDDFWPALANLRHDFDLPVIAVDTSTSYYRGGKGAFFTSSVPVLPDVMAWWGGAQTGYLHVATRYRVAEPLTLVSTWDGDELSLVREHHQLRAARKLDLSAACAAMDEACEVGQSKGIEARGLGLYRVLDAGARTDWVYQTLLAQGIKTRRFANGLLGIIPALDEAQKAAESLRDALGKVR